MEALVSAGDSKAREVAAGPAVLLQRLSSDSPVKQSAAMLVG